MITMLLQDYNATSVTTVEQPPRVDANHSRLQSFRSNNCSLPLPRDMWIGDCNITVEHFSWENMDHAVFLEEELQHQEQYHSSGAHMKEARGGVDSGTLAITPDLHHASGHLGPEEANASKRRRSLIKSASPSSRCMLSQAKRPKPCSIVQ